MSPRVALHVVLAAAILSGCGRRGELEDPGRMEPAAAGTPNLVPFAPNAAAAGELSTLDPGSPGAQEPTEGSAETSPRKRFLLDPLL